MLEDRYIRIGGLKMYYWVSGDEGAPVILIHGLGGSADIWMHNIEALALHHRVYVVDLPGFGRSDKPGLSFSPLDYGDVLNTFIAALKIDRASLVGQSLGGGIALHHALHFPENVGRLVLVDSAGLGQEVIWTLRVMSLPLLGELCSYPTRKGVELFFKFAVRDQSLITKPFVDRYYTFFSQPGFQAFLLRLVRRTINVKGVRAEMLRPIMNGLDRIKQPVLIVWGDKDRVLPLKHAHFARQRLPHAKLEIMEGCGHLPFFERSDQFNRMVLEFLK